METTIQHSFAASISQTTTSKSLWKRFINWADQQEENRFGWTAFAIAGHGCVFTIITLAVILATGNNFIFWPIAIAAMATSLITNLAALPTRITIPTLFITVLIDVAIVVTAIISVL
jgi:hypothetical protein